MHISNFFVWEMSTARGLIQSIEASSKYTRFIKVGSSDDCLTFLTLTVSLVHHGDPQSSQRSKPSKLHRLRKPLEHSRSGEKPTISHVSSYTSFMPFSRFLFALNQSRTQSRLLHLLSQISCSLNNTSLWTNTATKILRVFQFKKHQNDNNNQ